MQNCVCRSRPDTTMRTLVRPGGATSVRGGPAETAADVAGAVRALEGVGPSVVVVVVCGASDDGAFIVAAAAATSSARRGRILACSTAYVRLHITDCLRGSQGCELSRGASGSDIDRRSCPWPAVCSARRRDEAELAACKTLASLVCQKRRV
jgi:hypothetical protein